MYYLKLRTWLFLKKNDAIITTIAAIIAYVRDNANYLLTGETES